MSVEIINETSQIAIDEPDFVGLAYFIYEKMGIDRLIDLTIVFMNEEEISILHKEWMGLDGPTDVMSFPIDEIKPNIMIDSPPQNTHSVEIDDTQEQLQSKQLCLGDIAICPSIAYKQAATSGHSAHEEMLLLATHGILHLLGYDHAKNNEKTEMFELQRKLLIGYIASRERIPEKSVIINGLPK